MKRFVGYSAVVVELLELYEINVWNGEKSSNVAGQKLLAGAVDKIQLQYFMRRTL